MPLLSFSDNFSQISLNQIICIVYSGIMLANLKNTMQTKQHEMKKPQSYLNTCKNKIYNGLFFVVDGFWTESEKKFQFLKFKLELYSIYLYF